MKDSSLKRTLQKLENTAEDLSQTNEDLEAIKDAKKDVEKIKE